MRLARYRHGRTIALGRVDGESVLPITGRIDGVGVDMIGLIRDWERLEPLVASLPADNALPLDAVELLAPIARPGKIWGIGLNYADHIAEAGLPQPEHQSWFVMAATTVAGPYQPIERPKVSAALDYEAELVCIVGRGGRHLSADTCPDAIFGYCVGNDVSVRDWQLRSGQYSIGKSFDTHAPFGPWIVTADEVDPDDLEITCWVNGERRQHSNTRHLIFNPAAQVEHLSQAMTLEPGDILFTGTPGGVGAAMKPPVFLKPGDVVKVEIEGLGYIENRVIEEGGA